MKLKILLIFITLNFLANLSCFGQDSVEWSEEIELTIENFKGEVPEMAEDNTETYFFAGGMTMNYQMTSLEFMLTKNFNRYVTASYMPQSSWIEQGEMTVILIAMVNLDFDVMELFARKFRKRLWEKKNMASNTNFFSDEFNSIQNEYIAFSSKVNSEIQVAEDRIAVVQKYNEEVNAEIALLAEYCKLCKPIKKKKPKKKNKKN